jgi:hypothetical protein
VTEAGAGDLYDDFAGAGRIELDLFDPQRPALRVGLREPEFV